MFDEEIRDFGLVEKWSVGLALTGSGPADVTLPEETSRETVQETGGRGVSIHLVGVVRLVKRVKLVEKGRAREKDE